jgi:hypothetical protein
MLSFILDYPEFLEEITLGKNAVKSIIKKNLWKELAELIAENITKWNVELPINVANISKIKGYYLVWIWVAFLSLNFLTEADTNFTEKNKPMEKQ